MAKIGDVELRDNVRCRIGCGCTAQDIGPRAPLTQLGGSRCSSGGRVLDIERFIDGEYHVRTSGEQPKVIKLGSNRLVVADNDICAGVNQRGLCLTVALEDDDAIGATCE